MKRWIWTGSLAVWASSVAFSQQASAPSPAPRVVAESPASPSPGLGAPHPASAPHQVGDVLTFRTAGQPERRVRVLQVSGTAEADGLADVQDLATGARYSIPLKVAQALARANPATPAPSQSTMAPLPVTTYSLPPLTRTMPSAPPPRPPATNDNGWPRAATTPTPLFPSKPAAQATPGRAPGTSGRVRDDATAALPPVTSVRGLMRPDPRPPAAGSRKSGMPEAVAANTPAPPTQTATATPPLALPLAPPVLVLEAQAPKPDPVAATLVTYRPTPAPEPLPVPQPPPAAVAAPPARPSTPLLAVADLSLPPTQPTTSTVRPPLLAVKPPEYVTVAVAEYAPPDAPAPAPSASPAPVTPALVAAKPTELTPPAVVAAPPPPTVVPVAASLPSIVPPAEPPVVVTVPAAFYQNLPAQMTEEIQPDVNALFQALRPSVRERAATGLAEGRYGSRPEVKATLARAALSDPAPSVRAHCIRQLSRLGYHEATYLDYLGACADSGQETVKQAATDALAKLTSRN